eukprot:gb/GECG01015313.1/.p1 GENE.gb/GECG01015313.1/~~gb/GECG01015313.1/.p1  ORF type:complete len:141 (+),score=12.07 gb/GECG01015313.1/:1-423(+)
MGFLKAGKPLSWTDSLEYTRYVREQGIKQFLDAYFKILTRKNDVLLWGDEIEYHIVHFDEEERRPRVALVAPQVCIAVRVRCRTTEAAVELRALVQRPSVGLLTNDEFSFLVRLSGMGLPLFALTLSPEDSIYCAIDLRC